MKAIEFKLTKPEGQNMQVKPAERKSEQKANHPAIQQLKSYQKLL